MRFGSLSAALFFALPALAAYDSTWHKEAYWTGEYPAGFAVIKNDVVLEGRTRPDLDRAKTVSCPLPIKAVYHPWNQNRKAEYLTYSKIVPLVAKEDFEYDFDTESGGTRKLKIEKGQKLQFLIFLGEGYLKVKVGGRRLLATYEILEKMEPFNSRDLAQHEWVRLPCTNGKKAWVFMPDLVKAEGDNWTYLPGLDSWYRGFVEYGVVRDLTDEEVQ